MWVVAVAFAIYFAQAWINTVICNGPCLTRPMRPAGPIRPGATVSGVNEHRLRVDDFDYELPPEAIAQTPAEPRDSSRLLVLDRATGRDRARALRDVGRWLDPGDLLVVNDSRVLPPDCGPACRRRIGRGARPATARDDPARWEALVRPSRRLAVGTVRSRCRSGDRVEVGERLAGRHPRGPASTQTARGHGRRRRDAAAALHPRPLVARRSATRRSTRDRPGSAAAPDGGAALHTRAARARWRPAASRGRRSRCTSGSTRSGRSRASSSTSTASTASGTRCRLRRARRSTAASSASWRWARPRFASSRRRRDRCGRRAGPTSTSRRRIGSRAVDALVTNFHLPRSSLLLLVTAFVQAGMPTRHAFEARDRLLAAYRDALERGTGSSASATRC